MTVECSVNFLIKLHGSLESHTVKMHQVTSLHFCFNKVATRSILLPLITDTSYLLIGCPVIPVVVSLAISADDDEGLQNYTNENL